MIQVRNVLPPEVRNILCQSRIASRKSSFLRSKYVRPTKLLLSSLQELDLARLVWSKRSTWGKVTRKGKIFSLRQTGGVLCPLSKQTARCRFPEDR